MGTSNKAKGRDGIKKILIMDDVYICELLKLYLQSAGFAAVCFGAARCALGELDRQ